MINNNLKNKIVLFILILYSCSNTNKENLRDTNINEKYNTNNIFNILIDDITFNMVLINNSYIAETEVTEELWYTVLNWAVKHKAYIFSKNYLKNTNYTKYPINNITWRDALVFSNAFTEWYNEHNSNNEILSMVYYKDKEYKYPIKEVSLDEFIDLKKGSIDNPYLKKNADGFRLIYLKEWEYININKFNNNRSASFFAWFIYNSSNTIQEVKSLASNKYGLYDIYGNIAEFLFDWHPEYYGLEKILVGGSFNSSLEDLTTISFLSPNTRLHNVGFRIAKNN